MTAEMAGKAAAEGLWTSLRRLREQWMLVAFFAGAMIWARDTWEEFAPLPALVREQTRGLAQLEDVVARLEERVSERVSERAAADRSPVLGFPGDRHAMEDGTPGSWTVLRWRPVRALRADCVPAAIDAWMVDAGGAWFAVETELAPMPLLEGEQDLAFRLRVHPGMAPGRARAMAQIAFDCGTHRQVETAPWLQFRVLES